jgi:hypothetical protein
LAPRLLKDRLPKYNPSAGRKNCFWKNTSNWGTCSNFSNEDHSGFIDPAEITKIMEELGESRNGTLAYSLISSLQTTEKPISFDEFLSLVCPKVGEVKTKEDICHLQPHRYPTSLLISRS